MERIRALRKEDWATICRNSWQRPAVFCLDSVSITPDAGAGASAPGAGSQGERGQFPAQDDERVRPTHTGCQEEIPRTPSTERCTAQCVWSVTNERVWTA